MAKEILGRKQTDWVREFPLLEDIIQYNPVIWLNNKRETDPSDIGKGTAGLEDLHAAAARWKRFEPYLQTVFPSLKKTNGKMQSPLREINQYKHTCSTDAFGKQEKFYLKCDHLLPVAGSIKARGGVYEVLKLAEKLALQEKMIMKSDDYRRFSEKAFRQFFQHYTIGVGSTGNLALSIGIMGTSLGFNVEVFMSRDAKQWKKDLLRQHGVEVYEYKGDFSEAIKEGREHTVAKPNGYFIDDENSRDLFFGYSIAAFELKQQLKEKGIEVNADHPLFVYLPCGVGGSPGGIAFGLKKIFGRHVHCFFAEPTHSPSVLLGIMTGLGDKLSVQDFGLDNKTAADGLAVGRPSRFATSLSRQTVSGIYTEEDEEFSKMGARLWKTEGLFVEPSAAAGLSGPEKVNRTNYRQLNDIATEKATHIAWSTGGSLVPEHEREALYQPGKETGMDV